MELRRAWEKVRDQQVLIFFDPRAHANFISPELASKLGIRVEEMSMMGEAGLACPSHSEPVTPILGKLRLHIQSYVDEEEFHIMLLQDCDVLLGIPWCYRLHAVMDTFHKKIILVHRGKTRILDVKLKGEFVPVVFASAISAVIKNYLFAYLIFAKEVNEVESNLYKLYKNRLFSLPDEVLYITVALAFTAEYLLFNFHSTSHAGLEGRYHELLVLLIGLCILFSLLSAALPESFLVDLASGTMITLQGLWFYQIAFTLYGPWMPAGCHWQPEGPSCESPDFEMRGQSLADVQLSLIVSCLLVVVAAFYGIAVKIWGHPQDLYLFTSNHYKIRLQLQEMSLRSLVNHK
ncbi:hypothetical protein L7F22_019959 [Adiantum nelumboides]|nr:hypothetical protein [Adiantum nelumboides]